jgi:hypothetical protein
MCRGVAELHASVTVPFEQESARMSLVDHPISQSSLDISPIWTPVITAEVRKLQHPPVYIGTVQRICLFSDDFSSDSIRFQQ